MPKGLRDNETEQTQKTRMFVARLKEELGERVEIVEQTEMFSSAEARRIIQEEGGRSDEEHSEAARLVLESYIKKTAG
jgi:RNase H-fold protein (predicted Holliday junction resolvase)